jgi:hypothetical protein
MKIEFAMNFRVTLCLFIVNLMPKKLKVIGESVVLTDIARTFVNSFSSTFYQSSS